MTETFMQNQSHDDYNVACVCPKGVELAAVQAMLDDVHPALPIERDQNAYVLGRIGQHNVVIAVMPGLGNNWAATVATQLVNDFPAVRFALLVGIGAGVPGLDGKDDIRLGDVVVGQPSGTSSGVIQYDLGKNLIDGQFLRTGQLDKPPAILSSHVQKLEARQMLEGSQISTYVAQIAEKFPRARHQFSRPVQAQDHLFLSSYPHSGGQNCISCDVMRTVNRSRRDDVEPRVHYGIIGSANVCLKDPVLRDRLKQEMNLVCIEMEAAGLINSFPCLVIRGISDYADSHKNDLWQPYAAAVAAAYMKELLLTIPVQQVLRTSRVEKILTEDVQTHKLLSDILENEQQQNAAIDQQSRKDRLIQCHQAFKTSTYRYYKDINPERAPNTCEWITRNPQFKRWCSSRQDELLWLSADPGCGKSVFAKFLIDEEVDYLGPANMLYFFFKDNKDQDSLSLALSAMLHELFCLQPVLLHHAATEFEKHGVSVCDEVTVMWQILRQVTSDPTCSPTICVFDALDECCDRDRRQLINMICDFHRDSISIRTLSHTKPKPPLKLLVTSRPYDDIQRPLQAVLADLPQIRLRGEDHNDDIQNEIDSVVRYHVVGLKKEIGLSNAAADHLQARLLSMKHRTYLWLHLALDNVRNSYRDSLYPDRAVIQSVPTSVIDAYERILQRINPQQKPIARKILLIILGARRPLTLREMSHALGAAQGFEARDSSTNGPCVKHLENNIREWCGLFVFINRSRLFLIHQTAKEFLIDTSGKGFTDGHKWQASLSQRYIELEMARLCTQYLCFAEISEADKQLGYFMSMAHDQGLTDDNPNREGLARDGNFLHYCATHWLTHTCDEEIPTDTELTALVTRLYDTANAKGYVWFKMAWLTEFEHLCHKKFAVKAFPLQFAAALKGHVNILKILYAEYRFDLETQDGASCTALHWAVLGGHESVVRWLHEAGADLFATGYDRPGYLLPLASELGHIEIVRFLLAAGANVNVESRFGGTALYAASLSGHEDVLGLLLEHDADPSLVMSGANVGDTALRVAFRSSKFGAVRVLLRAGASLETQSPFFLHNNLLATITYGEVDLVQLLISSGAKPDVRGWANETGLIQASRHGHKDIVRILIEAGADVDAKGLLGNTATSEAKVGSHKIIMEMLRDAGAAEINVFSEEFASLALRSVPPNPWFPEPLPWMRPFMSLNQPVPEYVTWRNISRAVPAVSHAEMFNILPHVEPHMNHPALLYDLRWQPRQQIGRYIEPLLICDMGRVFHNWDSGFFTHLFVCDPGSRPGYMVRVPIETGDTKY